MNPNCLHCKIKPLATQELNDEQMSKLANDCTTVTFKKREVIFKENSLSLNIAYLQKGLIKLHMKGVGGQDQILKLVKAPNFIGIPTSLGDKINKYSATALEETTVCFISLETFKDLLLSNNRYAYNIIVDLCQKELENFKTCINKIQKRSSGLLADLILDLACSIYQCEEFEIPLTRQEIADLIGTSRENVSRTLSNFNKDGLIHLDKQKIKIINFERLQKISNFG